ncbi:MAG: shikimate kinase [Gemmatimonadota bacterium]|nr:shikimate kinase [Gemmatimonadota bacterium]
MPISPVGSPPDSGAAHVILVGLPGAGKSTVGRLLSRRLGVGFLDFDSEIVKRAGMPITEIFAKGGEDAFRSLERTLSEEVAAMTGSLVLAPGGGWVSQPDVVALLRRRSRLVYLRISPAGAVRRMGRRMSTRPLLQKADPRRELERLLASRRSVYETAELVVDVENLDAQRVADDIMRRLTKDPA